MYSQVLELEEENSTTKFENKRLNQAMEDILEVCELNE